MEPRGHVSNSFRLAITCCWWPWRREARSFLLVYGQNQKAPCERGQIAGFALDRGALLEARAGRRGR